MHRRGTRLAAALAAACLMGFGAVACGGGDDNGGSSSSKSTSSSAGGGKEGGDIKVLIGTAPDYLDPQQGYTTQAAEAHWLSYLGLLTYTHADGPGRRQADPRARRRRCRTVSDDGKTYTLTLRKGLEVLRRHAGQGERLRLHDRARDQAQLGRQVVLHRATSKGAADLRQGQGQDDLRHHDRRRDGQDHDHARHGPTARSRTCSRSRRSGLVPTGTPMKNLSNDPPPGVGPYMIKRRQAEPDLHADEEPEVRGHDDPGHPGRARRQDHVSRSPRTRRPRPSRCSTTRPTCSTPATRCRRRCCRRSRRKASDRFAKQTDPVDVLLLPEHTKPSRSTTRWRARPSTSRSTARRCRASPAASSSRPAASCPEGIVGHPTGAVPVRRPRQARTWRRPSSWCRQSGMAGQPVTVWGQERSPRKQYVEYYTDVLNQIGFKATPKIIADEVYFPTIGNAKTKPQTGFADWIQDFPNPSDFYLLLDAQVDPADQQPELQQGQRPAHPERAEASSTRCRRRSSTRVAEPVGRSSTSTRRRRPTSVVYGSEQVPQFFSDRDRLRRRRSSIRCTATTGRPLQLKG